MLSYYILPPCSRFRDKVSILFPRLFYTRSGIAHAQSYPKTPSVCCLSGSELVQLGRGSPHRGDLPRATFLKMGMKSPASGLRAPVVTVIRRTQKRQAPKIKDSGAHHTPSEHQGYGSEVTTPVKGHPISLGPRGASSYLQEASKSYEHLPRYVESRGSTVHSSW